MVIAAMDGCQEGPEGDLDTQDQQLQPSSIKILMLCMNRRMSNAHHPLTLNITKQIQRIT